MNATVYGRIGRDAEVREAGSTQVANFSVALNVYSKDGKGVTWVSAALFGARAEKLAPYLTSGSSVALSGDLKLRTYDSERDGGSKTELTMNVETVALLGSASKPRAASAGGDDSDESIPF